MYQPTDKHKPADSAKHELEDATISPPAWALDHAHPGPNVAGSKPIPKDFIDAVLEVIAKSIEQVLADIVAHCVGAGVEQAIRPLAEEIALLRIAIEHDWDSDGQRKRGNHADVGGKPTKT